MQRIVIQRRVHGGAAGAEILQDTGYSCERSWRGAGWGWRE